MNRKQVLSEQKFHMYNTNNDKQDNYCVLYYVNDAILGIVPGETVKLFAYQLIPYCLRLSNENQSNIDFDSGNNPNFTFKELKDQNISSEQLFAWSIPIDLIEEYEMFLNNITSLSFTKELLIYNCTLPWFGPICQFAFDPLSNKSLNEIIVFNFESKPIVELDRKLTCYKHLNCSPLWICLDWRDICDRKIDCLNGEDEINCWQLEINECNENEFRCLNGQCIPEEFVQDIEKDPDCFDKTDQFVHGHFSVIPCDNDPSFRCEETTCHPGSDRYISCDDGSCTSDTTFCFNGRNFPFLKDNCSIVLLCIIFRIQKLDRYQCQQYYSNMNFIKEYCPPLYELSYGPLMLGHVRFIYNTTKIQINQTDIPLPEYICYNEKICGDFLPTTININNFTCRYFSEIIFQEIDLSLSKFVSFHVFLNKIRNLFQRCLITPNETFFCNYSTMYQCQNSSKCISKSRLFNGIIDCPYTDDENFEFTCSLNDIRFRRKCYIHEFTIETCIIPTFIADGNMHCDKNEILHIKDDVFNKYDEHIYFQRLCDGKTDIKPILIDDTLESDETNCQSWPCNNTYTRCDGFWSCKNGADEINCPNSRCPDFHHPCVFPDNQEKLSCLPISRAGDGIVDCLGASDERKLCRGSYLTKVMITWQCFNTTICLDPSLLCSVGENCPLRDDETFCSYKTTIGSAACSSPNQSRQNDMEKYFCQMIYSGLERPPIIPFKISDINSYPLYISTNTDLFISSTQIKSSLVNNKQLIQLNNNDLWRCNRGLPIYIRTKKDKYKLDCLCPPSYYGEQCQYQNQRISLTIQIRATSDWFKLWIFLITLVDQEENIESYEYIEYFPSRDCKMKYNIYLLYSTRPKNSSKNYSIRIHSYNKLTLKYRSSWIYPIKYSFLPVHRMAVLLIIPYNDIQSLVKCKHPCIHGRCFNNVNNLSSTFCQCDPDWSGIQCDIKYTCNCAIGSLCFSNSICLCPKGRFGPRCYLKESSCLSDSCANNGQGLSMDYRYMNDNSNKITCICSEAYTGERCEHQRTRINLSFHPQISIPTFLIIHFITVQKEEEHIRSSIMKKMPLDEVSLSFYTETKFHLAVAETLNSFYLIILQEKEIITANITTEIVPSHRCISIYELFDEIHSKQHILKRLKLYHSLCEQHLNLVCFYDDVHICLCNLARQANCFQFDHNITYNCYGYNYCENNGRCFRDDSDCPKFSSCSCEDCYFGSKCQFTTQGSTLSLDIVLTYYIKPNIQLNNQSITIKISIIITTIIISLGFLSNCLSLITFKSKTTRNIGSGVYLFISSIFSIFAMIILTIKFIFLLSIQIGSINHHSFIHLQCISIDFLIRFTLSTIDWLNVCVAIDRVINIFQGIYFNKEKSKQIAKRIIPVVIIFTLITHIHDPIHRYIVNDEEEQRIWCIVKYSSLLQIFDRFINIIHYSIPFGINLISSIIIIIFSARLRSTTQKNISYKEHLYKQFQQHKHLLISSFILVILSLPRLIISLLSGCMKSARNPWLYLIAYFISFISPMMTFVTFVLPSETYTKEFKNSRFYKVCLIFFNWVKPSIRQNINNLQTNQINQTQTVTEQATTSRVFNRRKKELCITVFSIIIVFILLGILIPTSVITRKKIDVLSIGATTVTSTATAMITATSTIALATEILITKSTITKTSTTRQIVASTNITVTSKWTRNGATIAGTGESGGNLYELARPESVYIDDDNQRFYIVDHLNHRIIEWKFYAESGQIIAGGNQAGNRSNQLNRPTDLVVNKKSGSFIICDRGNRRVVQWYRQNNTNGQTIISNIDCYGLTMDKDENLYVCDSDKNEVRQWKVGSTNGRIVAGGNEQGDHLNQLNDCNFIFVDDDYSIYISDARNQRIIKWIKDAKEGIVVAGGQSKGNSLTQFNFPYGLIVDRFGSVYVSDQFNHRVMRWLNGSKQGSIVVGGNGSGNKLNQLKAPRGLSFDQQGNLYVVDNYNHRIQLFHIQSN